MLQKYFIDLVFVFELYNHNVILNRIILLRFFFKMNKIFPIQTKNSLKQHIIFSEDNNTESSFSYSSYKGQGNFMYSSLITRLIRFIILILMMMGVWLGKSYGTVNKKRNRF